MSQEPEMNHNWGLSRIGVGIRLSPSDPWTKLVLPNLLTINIKNEQTPVDGLEQHNSGYIYKPQRFTFSIDIPANTSTYDTLRSYALNRYQFYLQVTEDVSTNPNYEDLHDREYKGVMELLTGCAIDDMSEPFRVGELPMITFNGQALRFSPARDPSTPNITEHDYGSNVFP